MVYASKLKKVLEPIENKEIQKECELHPSIKKYERYFNNPIFNYTKDFPLNIIDNNVININESKKVYVRTKDGESYKIKVSGDEFLVANIIIIVPKNYSSKIHIIEENPNSYTQISIIVESNCDVVVGREIFSTVYSSLDTFMYENSSCPVYGAYSISGEESLIFTSGNLLGENSYTDINISGIVKNSGVVTNDTSLFVGKYAPNSNGYQKMNNIIGDSSSRVTSKPILEICNNNVKCSHGASVAPLEENIRYYGKSKGIDEKDLIDLVSQGFFEVVREFVR